MATLLTLVNTARTAKSRKAQASEGRWVAVMNPDTRTASVYHYSTHMVNITVDNEIIPINAGWGSMTDKKGIRKIAQGIGVFASYKEIYSGVCAPRETPPSPPIARFLPKASAENKVLLTGFVWR